MPETPVPAENCTRRTFFGRFGLWITAAVGSLATFGLAIPVIGYFLGPLRRRSAPWVTLGPVGEFPAHETRLATFDNPLREAWDGITAQTGVYVRNKGTDAGGLPAFQVFSVNCAHLGCPVSWFPQSGLFMCPCHGGVYYEDGRRASGPPPRGLYEAEWRVRDGKLEVRAPHYPTLQNTLKDNA